MDYQQIKTLCKQNNLSIKELGERIGMSDAGLYRAFINNSLKVETLEKIAGVLGVPVSFFFNDNIDLTNPCDLLKSYVKDRKLTFDIDSILNNVFWDNYPELSKDILDFSKNNFNIEEITRLLNKVESKASEREVMFFYIDKQNGENDYELITKYLLIYSFHLSLIKVQKKRNILKELQLVMFGKYLDFVKSNSIFSFLLKEDFIEYSDFHYRVENFIQKYMNITTSYFLLTQKGMTIESDFFKELGEMIQNKGIDY